MNRQIWGTKPAQTSVLFSEIMSNEQKPESSQKEYDNAHPFNQTKSIVILWTNIGWRKTGPSFNLIIVTSVLQHQQSTQIHKLISQPTKELLFPGMKTLARKIVEELKDVKIHGFEFRIVIHFWLLQSMQCLHPVSDVDQNFSNMPPYMNGFYANSQTCWHGANWKCTDLADYFLFGIRKTGLAWQRRIVWSEIEDCSWSWFLMTPIWPWEMVLYQVEFKWWLAKAKLIIHGRMTD